ncbi:tRNA lysidine(34) synthetase TilS [Pantoea sp. 1.19]|uniref:tRNA lysidine(34) synthetase TilS n=1 Tax=Pantoea sp. 1.19 TaxID=1925589 RepID=UPI000AC234CF|nr:tRNA lysidine(34) synthetase TilS [Pantoea sp. 1.19]
MKTKAERGSSLLTPAQQRWLHEGAASLLVAYSGGLDSALLLHELAAARARAPRLRLRAIHIHHGLSPHAAAWVTHCQQQCETLGVALKVVAVTVDGREQGIEGAARAARYAAFAAHLQPGERLVTAQHLDDQCETLLLALRRGSGPAGLAAMPELKALGEGQHWRPLLAVSRTDIEARARQLGLRWIEDESNADTRFDRNFLRHRALPPLTARWPHFAAACARTAALCAEQEALLDELLAPALAAAQRPDGSLLIAPLTGASVEKRHALLRRWLAGQGLPMPSRDALIRLWQEVACSREDASPRLTLAGGDVRRYQGALYWQPTRPPLHVQQLDWPDLQHPLRLPAGIGQLMLDPAGQRLRAPRVGERVQVRFGVSGHLHVVGRCGGRALKKLWQEYGVPPWRRPRMPVLFYNEVAMLVPGLFITRDALVNGGDEAIGISWCGGA